MAYPEGLEGETMPRVIHFEIHADEPERAIRFYNSVFGWEFTKFPNAITEYWVVKTGESSQPGIDGGLLRRDVRSRAWASLPTSAPSRWRTSISIS